MDEPKQVFEFDIRRNPIQSPTVHQVKSKQKAIVLYWMWLAELAITNRKDPEAKSLSMGSAADIASDFIRKMFKLDVKAQSIEEYYELSRKNAEYTKSQWDYTVAAIMRRRGQIAYGEFKDFLNGYERKQPLPSASARRIIRKVDLQALGNWKWLLETWEEFESGRLPCPPDLDAELEVAHNIPQRALVSAPEIQ